MSLWKMLVEEIRYRRLSFLLSLLAVVLTTTLFVAAPTLIAGFSQQTQDETRKIMISMGFNLMIVHEDTDMTDFWSSDFASVDMPQDYVHKLAEARDLSLVTHLVATLQQKIDWNDRNILLVGYLPEVTQTHRSKKKPMGYNIEPGKVLVGHELGKDLNAGDTIDVLGKQLTVDRVLEEKGSKEDITLAVNLEDAQAILDKPDRINEILALGCRCAGERLPQIRKQLTAALPGTKITEYRSIAVARAEQRDMVQSRMESWAMATTPALIVACGLFVGLFTMTNVRERRMEIGVLRSLGKGSLAIAGLFITKAIALGFLGALLGFWIGTFAATTLGLQVLQIDPKFMHIDYLLLGATLIGTPLICAMAAYLPTLSAVSQDPAVVLRDP